VLGRTDEWPSLPGLRQTSPEVPEQIAVIYKTKQQQRFWKMRTEFQAIISSRAVQGLLTARATGLEPKGSF
jgi:hypothetical protein